MVKNAGSLQPLGVRQLATPRPYCAPNTKPPFNMEGTTATQSADPMTSSGMPVSGAAWISSRTVAAAFTRLAAGLSSSSEAKQLPARASSRNKFDSFFIFITLSFLAVGLIHYREHLIVGKYSVDQGRNVVVRAENY